MNAKQIFLCFITSLFAVIFYLKNYPVKVEDETKLRQCYKDLLKNSSVCNLVCPYGKFALPGMKVCHEWLTCNDELNIISTISISVVKSIYLAKWKNYKVVLSVLSSQIYEEDFKQNLFMVKSLFSNHQVVQLIGYCNYSIVSKYYELGSALNVKNHFIHEFKNYDNIKIRFKLCISYVSVLGFLHSSPVGIRVMCDSSTLEKTLSQYLLSENFEIIVNDLDATPEVNKTSERGIICGNKILGGTFVAPEQLWPYENLEYDPQVMKTYDEKTDIWKIPNICNWFLGNGSNADFLKYKLFSIHKLCKEVDPVKRPNSSHVLEVYKKIYDEI